MENVTKLPVYSKAEEKLNVITHLSGTIVSLVALIAMLTIAIINKDAMQIIGSLVFGGSLVWLYLMSTLYHGETNIEKRRLRQKFDHLSINILIAGSVTIYMIAGVRGNIGYIVTGAVWGLSLISIILNSINVRKFRAPTMVIYILTGWSPVFVANYIIQAMSIAGFVMILIGGLFYTLGLIFYAIKKPFMHATWHFFVLGGSISHIIAAIGWVLLL